MCAQKKVRTMQKLGGGKNSGRCRVDSVIGKSLHGLKDELESGSNEDVLPASFSRK